MNVKVIFGFRAGMENAVFVARDSGAEKLVGREGTGEADLEIVGGDGGGPGCCGDRNER